ncbi:nitroreductase family protein [Streptomyces sp. A73]|uniref:nitroreductase family protein n=1 Tax=unclassified Streptomyces TaxID=2593676 RepID=UPI000C17DD9F|nr:MULTISPECIES: nitroreductase family protein [unclassified Streptomyces]MBQ0862618.1 nitroreductase family protein [Streptomyces sp. RK75]MBQ1124599.1 nitroreductase family protein [Streptomyces sp. B15]MBQ1160923.1 nitroreductase family protein [Streptomyces sp. A73]
MVRTSHPSPGSGPSRCPTVPLRPLEIPAQQAEDRARSFYEIMSRRRTVRDFDSRPVPEAVLEWAVRTAATAPSGAHVQPWRFVVLTDPDRKRRLRAAAEEEEREFYRRRASDEWLAALAPLGTDEHKPFLQKAPAVIVVFEVHKGPHTPRPYYTKESVGIAVGFLLATLHQAGLATLTHTPSPMRFLNEICERPAEERGAYVIPVGYPAPGTRVPDLTRKELEEVLVRL